MIGILKITADLIAAPLYIVANFEQFIPGTPGSYFNMADFSDEDNSGYFVII